MDSLYNTFTLQEKVKISKSALSYARNAKNLVANSQQSLEYKIEHLRRYEIEWHLKFTLSFACLLFMFIGAPLGAIIRKGGLGLPLIISVFFFILYYVLSLTGEKLVRESIMLDYQGMWMTSAFFLIIGSFVTYKATTDSSLFNMDTYSNFIKKIFGQRYSVIDMINIQTQYNESDTTEAKKDNIYSSLHTLNDNINGLLMSNNYSFTPADFGVSLFSLRNESELILFERFYLNTFKAVVNHPVFHNKNIRAKAFEFPAFNALEFQGTKFIQIIYLILAFLPPLTLIAAARQYIKLIVFRSKLKHIKQLIPELGTLLKISEPEEKRNEDTPNL